MSFNISIFFFSSCNVCHVFFTFFYFFVEYQELTSKLHELETKELELERLQQPEEEPEVNIFLIYLKKNNFWMKFYVFRLKVFAEQHRH